LIPVRNPVTVDVNQSSTETALRQMFKVLYIIPSAMIGLEGKSSVEAHWQQTQPRKTSKHYATLDQLHSTYMININ